MTERIVLDRRNVPFAMVTKAALLDERLKASDKSVYSVLCMYAGNSTSDCYPKRETIMKKAGISDKTLRKSIATLKEYGYIAVEPRVKHYGNSSNRYILLNVPEHEES